MRLLGAALPFAVLLAARALLGAIHEWCITAFAASHGGDVASLLYLGLSVIIFGLPLISIWLGFQRRRSMRIALFSMPVFGRRAEAFLRAVALGFGFWMLSAVFSWLIGSAVPNLEDSGRVYADVSSAGAVSATVGLLSGCVVAPLFEEAWLRGVGLRGLLSCGLPFAAANAAQAVVFGILHLSLAQCIMTAGFGLMAGLLAWRSGSIVPGMLAHAISNSPLPSAAVSSLAAQLHAYSAIELMGYRSLSVLANGSFARFLLLLALSGTMCCVVALARWGRRNEDRSAVVGWSRSVPHEGEGRRARR